MLTKNQLKQLRNEITLNSLLLKDYSNSLYIKENTAAAFFGSYLDEICSKAAADGCGDYDIIEIIDKYDNINNLYDYYSSFEYDPLIQDDYIAYSSDTIFSGVVVYDIQYGCEDYVLCASYHNNSYGFMEYDRITKNKVYYDRQGDTYIKKYNHRYYLKDFIKNI